MLKTLDFTKIDALLNSDVLRQLSPLQRPKALKAREVAQEHIASLSALIDLQLPAQGKLQIQQTLLVDRLALEQSSAGWISQYKNKLLPEGSNIIDLCCGMGGDSLHLHRAHSILGIDLSIERLKMFQYNMRHYSHRYPLQSDATLPAIKRKADILLCDPDRRSADRRRNWNPDDLCPNLQQIEHWLSYFDGALLKLSPSLNWKSLEIKGDIDFLGGSRDCREALIRRGSMASAEPTLRAVVHDCGSMEAPWRDVLSAQPEIVPTPQSFLSEPAKVLIRSGLNRWYAAQNGHALFHNDIAYLNSEKPIPHPLFKNYPIIAWGPANSNKIKQALSKHQLRVVEVKKRGSDKDPAQELKKWRKIHSDGAPAFLFYTQSSSGHLFLLTAPPIPFS